MGYYKDPTDSYGTTTELTALLTFWLGYLMKDYEVLAISIGIVVTILLASKHPLHRFVKDQVTEEEFFDTLKFLAVVFVVYPFLPDRHVDPWGFLNPTQIWTLVILISAIGYAGYVLVKMYGSRKGLAISSILGGIVSTTAVTLSLAERSAKENYLSRICGNTGVMANAIQGPRLLFLIWIVSEQFGRFLLIPISAMALVGLLIGSIGAVIPRKGSEIGPITPSLRNPFSLIPVLKFGAFFVGVFFVSKMSQIWFGNEGILIVSFLTGIGSVSAIALSLANMVQQQTLTIDSAAIALVLALVSNSLTKWTIAFINGTRSFAVWLGAGLVLILVSGVILILWQVLA
jgi:uncharacterized membrane protein (DUF4010 family)